MSSSAPLPGRLWRSPGSWMAPRSSGSPHGLMLTAITMWVHTSRADWPKAIVQGVFSCDPSLNARTPSRCSSPPDTTPRSSSKTRHQRGRNPSWRGREVKSPAQSEPSLQGDTPFEGSLGQILRGVFPRLILGRCGSGDHDPQGDVGGGRRFGGGEGFQCGEDGEPEVTTAFGPSVVLSG